VQGPFELLDGHEQVLYTAEGDSGLAAIIAVHSTALGPALGGTRFYPYASESEALVDVLRLSQAMTYKAACAGLDHGGGKAVIIGEPDTAASEALLRAYGRAVASLGGRYVTACDVGTKPAHLSTVARETRWATGGLPSEGGSGDSGTSTADGVCAGIVACLARVTGDGALSGRHVAIQGVGKVGGRLARLLAEAGARLTLADTDTARVGALAEELGAEVVAPAEIHAVDAEVFSPNALGAVLDGPRIAELGCRIVAGGANNQLAAAEHGQALADRGVVYAPDFVINAGGLIQVADELHLGGYDPERVRGRVAAIADRLAEVFELAELEGLATAAAADRLAQRRITAVGGLRSFWLPGSSPV
jgi:glutamate dehydrogenase/leucine dehydrogenase